MFTSVTYICKVDVYIMVNNAHFIKRLEKILEEYELTAAAFAQKIAVGRASISHILSGRNKPSLDFVLKVIARFPEVDLYWLLLGQGSFPKKETVSSPAILAPQKEATLFSEQPLNISKNKPAIKASPEKSIKRIVIFYTDQSFESFEN